MKKIILESEEKKSRSDIVAFLKEIAEKIDSGTVTMVQGDQSMELEIPENLTLELKVQEKEKENKAKKMQIEIELEWYLGEKKEAIKLG